MENVEHSNELTEQELYNKAFEEADVDIVVTDNTVIEKETYEIPTEEIEDEEEITETEEDETSEENEEENNEDLEQSNETDDGDDQEAEDENSNEEVKNGRTIKWNGQEIFIDDNEIEGFIQRGFDYTKKSQDLAKWRGFIELIDESGLSKEDLKALQDAKSGNPDAIAHLVKSSGVDIYDIKEDTSYAPVIENKNYELEDVINTIKKDETNSVKIDRYIETMPEQTKKVLAQNPAILQGLYEDTVNGTADKIMPEVIKTMVMNPNADFLQTYKSIGESIYSQKQQVKEEKVVEAKPEVSREIKKKATISKKSNSKIKEHQDVWENEELFEKMNRLMDDAIRKSR